MQVEQAVTQLELFFEFQPIEMKIKESLTLRFMYKLFELLAESQEALKTDITVFQSLRKIPRGCHLSLVPRFQLSPKKYNFSITELQFAVNLLKRISTPDPRVYVI